LSYLYQSKSAVSSVNQCIISFWVRVQERADDDEFDFKPPPPISQMLGTNQVAFAGSSYQKAPGPFGGGQFTQPHIWCYPFPGPESNDPHSYPASYKDGVVPFLTFGDPNIEFNRVEWKLRQLNTVWVYGNGGVPQALMSMYPEASKALDDKGDATGKIKGIVPPSYVGLNRKGELRVCLQTNSKATYTGCAWAQKSSKTSHIMTPISCQNVLVNPHPCSEPEGWVDMSTKQSIQPNQFTGFNFEYEDVSSLECNQHPETFIMDSGVMISDNNWHHILISIDLSGVAAVGGHDSYHDLDSNGKPIENPPPPSGAKGEIKAEALGIDGNRPALPGPWGQYSGINGEYALAPFGCLPDNPGPDGYTYEQLACYGAPFENMGKYSYADDPGSPGGTITSTCRAWLAIDGVTYNKEALNHDVTYKQCRDRRKDGSLLKEFDNQAIAPVNAFLIPGAEIRKDMRTNMTHWEREYRTILGKFNGPACKMPNLGEMRQLDYVRPKYEFSGASISLGGKPFAIPGGPQELWGKHDRNYTVELADLHFYSGKFLDLTDSSRINLFRDPDLGRPQGIMMMDKHMNGKPVVRLHWASHWKQGLNTGSAGGRQTGSGSGTDPKIIKPQKPRGEDGNFVPVPNADAIDRVSPDPVD
jgi:hypothetical protein